MNRYVLPRLGALATARGAHLSRERRGGGGFSRGTADPGRPQTARGRGGGEGQSEGRTEPEAKHRSCRPVSPWRPGVGGARRVGGACIVRSAGHAGSPRPQHGVSLTVGCRAAEAGPAPQGGGGGGGAGVSGAGGGGGWRIGPPRAELHRRGGERGAAGGRGGCCYGLVISAAPARISPGPGGCSSPPSPHPGPWAHRRPRRLRRRRPRTRRSGSR